MLLDVLFEGGILDVAYDFLADMQLDVKLKEKCVAILNTMLVSPEVVKYVQQMNIMGLLFEYLESQDPEERNLWYIGMPFLLTKI